MNYKLIEDKSKSFYNILETKTEQVITSFPGDKFLEARAFMRQLNLGGGFDGWTPSFLLKNAVKSYK
jgi:hypothetical protein